MTNTDSGGSATGLADRAEEVREQTTQAAGTAADEAKKVASTAGDEAQKVVAETKQQAQQVLEEARGLLGDQALAQRDHLVGMLGTLSDDLERMGSQADSGLAGDLVRSAAQQVRGISGRIDGKQPGDLLEEVRSYARRRPGTFLLGALAAGVVAGRLARGAQQAQSSSGGQHGASSSGSPSTAPVPSQRSEVTQPLSQPSLQPTPQSAAAAAFPADRPGEFQ